MDGVVGGLFSVDGVVGGLFSVDDVVGRLFSVDGVVGGLFSVDGVVGGPSTPPKSGGVVGGRRSTPPKEGGPPLLWNFFVGFDARRTCRDLIVCPETGFGGGGCPPQLRNPKVGGGSLPSCLAFLVFPETRLGTPLQFVLTPRLGFLDLGDLDKLCDLGLHGDACFGDLLGGLHGAFGLICIEGGGGQHRKKIVAESAEALRRARQ